MSDHRAADHDRERVAERLRDAAAEGRLTAEELEERLGAAFGARTYGELEAVVADLPPPRERVRSPWRSARPQLPGFVATSLLLVAIWAAAGAGYFWPIWPILGWGFFVLAPGKAFGGCGRHRRRRAPI